MTTLSLIPFETLFGDEGKSNNEVVEQSHSLLFSVKVSKPLETVKPMVTVTDLLIQRGPSADSVTRPVEALSQRVSSRLPSLPLFCQAYASMQLLYSK